MSRDEHYVEAERLLHVAGDPTGLGSSAVARHQAIVAQAQVHADLAGVDVAVAR